VCVAPEHLLKGPNQVEPPDREWPCDGDSLDAWAGRWVCQE
jgi:hypothetical protein